MPQGKYAFSQPGHSMKTKNTKSRENFLNRDSLQFIYMIAGNTGTTLPVISFGPFRSVSVLRGNSLGAIWEYL
jgi:hypothetical protein